MRVYLTGGLRVETAGLVVDRKAFDFPHAQLVVAYLVCERGRPVAWTEISELLAHSAASPIQADVLVEQLASTLAAKLPASELRCAVATIELVLPRETWVDVEAAADAIHEAEGALRAGRTPDAFGPSAIAHHISRRPFLPGEQGPWVERHRERLHGILLRALEARGEVFLWNSETALAVEAAREVVELEPYRETGHQLLGRALAACGNTAQALKAYERCRQLLREGLGVEPSAQTRRVFELLAPMSASVSHAKSGTQDVAQTRDATAAPSDLRSLIQRALAGDYVVERELSGGMSRVFVAKERALGRRVVIKVLPPNMAENAVAQRFAREVQLAARLQHPNIVPVLSAGVVDGVLPYYTMPYVAGESLRAVVSATPPLAVSRVVTILRDVARALAFAHGEGVIHRDIKPENILLTGDAALVTDFGIAKAVNDTGYATLGPSNRALTNAGTSLGTPQYMAPEQILADPSMDHRADIYSFGVLSYELLTGRLPFGDGGPYQRITARFAEKPLDVSLLRPDTPAVLSAIVVKCLERDVHARPQSMRDVIVHLETCSSG
jgi:tRNA A-37 threonylcarbamoyl transferase component Bud32